MTSRILNPYNRVPVTSPEGSWATWGPDTIRRLRSTPRSLRVEGTLWPRLANRADRLAAYDEAMAFMAQHEGQGYDLNIREGRYFDLWSSEDSCYVVYGASTASEIAEDWAQFESRFANWY